MATLEKELVTEEEFRTTLRGLATKGDIKTVVDRILSLEGRLSNVERVLSGMKRDLSGMKRDLVLSLAAVNIVAAVALYLALLWNP